MKRAIRRHHYRRLQNNRKHYYGYGDADYGEGSIGKMAECRLGKVTEYPCDCSCVCCGNPRKWFGQITLKEHVSRVDFQEQCLEEGLKFPEHNPRRGNREW